MKQLYRQLNAQNKTEFRQNQKDRSTLKHSMPRVKGHKLFRMSLTTGIVEEVVVINDTINLATMKGERKAKYEAGYVYDQSLNLKNAKRRFNRDVNKLIEKSKLR